MTVDRKLTDGWLRSPNWPLPPGWTPAPAPAFDGTQLCHDRPDWLDASDTEGKRALCRRCRFTGACAAWALTHDEHGMLGAMTRAERLDIVLRFPRTGGR